MIEPTSEPAIQGSSASEALASLRRFEGTPSAFLAQVLEQLLEISGAARGAILRLDPENKNQVDVLAISPALPAGSTEPLWLNLAAEDASGVASSGRSLDRPLGDGRLIVVAMGMKPQGALVAALVVDQVDSRVPIPAARVFELGAALVDLYDVRQSAADVASPSLRPALLVTAAMGEQSTFRGAALALVNEAAGLFRASRVTLGLMRGRQIHLEAMSHTEKINRSADLVRTIESAMEECFDQDIELITGPDGPAGDSPSILRETMHVVELEGGAEVCQLPLRRGGAPAGVLCLERARGDLWTNGDVEAARLACELLTPRLLELRERDRWVGAKAGMQARRSVAWALGAQHTWAKLLGLALIALVLVAVFVDGVDRTGAPFVIQTPSQRIVAAPFGGYLESASALPGDQVRAGESSLARLSTSELEIQLADARARRLASERQAAIARRESKEADAQIAEAQRDQAQAEIDLLVSQIERATLVAPIDGLVVEQDLRQRIGGVVQIGEPLFRIVPGDALIAELAFGSERIAELEVGQSGSVATRSFPERRIPCVIESIAPAGEIVEGSSIFLVRARLESPPDWLRPGMEGVAKVNLGKKPLGWLWTRRMVNWVRLKFWL